MNAKIKKLLVAIGGAIIAALSFLCGKNLHRNGKSDAEAEDAISGLHDSTERVQKLAGEVRGASDEVRQLGERIGESTDKLGSANEEFARILDEIEATGHSDDDSL